MEFHDIGRVITMKSHDADANTFHILEVLKKSCSLIIKNMTSLLILSVVLFVVLDFTYGTIEEKVSELMQHEYVSAHIDDFKQRDFAQAIGDYNLYFTEPEGDPLLAPPSPVAFIFFSFLLPVAIIRLLLAGVLFLLLPGEGPDGLGTLVSSHVINFLYAVLSAIFSAVCYRELNPHAQVPAHPEGR